MIYRLHDEGMIGFKKLSDADLGIGNGSHQTHIGLYEDVLTFLSNPAYIDNAALIYNGHICELPVELNKITNLDGTVRSPKIKSNYGGNGKILTVTK